MNVHLICTDGREEIVNVPFREISKLIGADTTDTVNLRDGRVMLVDDAGWEFEVVDHGDGHFEHKPTRARKPINEKATALYHAVCYAGTTHQIVGDVAIVVDAEVA